MWLVTQKLFIKKSLMAISSSQSYCNQLSHTCHSLPKLHCLSAAMLPRPPFRPFTRLCEDGHTKLNVSSMPSLQILAFNVEFAQKSSQMNPRETRKVNCVISGLLLKKNTLSIFQIIPSFLGHYANLYLAETWKNQLWLKICYNSNCSVF